MMTSLPLALLPLHASSVPAWPLYYNVIHCRQTGPHQSVALFGPSPAMFTKKLLILVQVPVHGVQADFSQIYDL